MMAGHHHLESEHLFPLLRRHHLRSTDVGFLDAYDRDHLEIRRLVDRLDTDPAIAPALLDLFDPHVRDEELGLAPERLCTIVTAAQLVEIGREIDAARDALLRR
jgi:hypothetical protein